MAAEDLQKVTDQLDGEAREDAQLREQYGSKWNRPASQALNSTMREKIAGEGCVHRTGSELVVCAGQERRKQLGVQAML